MKKSRFNPGFTLKPVWWERAWDTHIHVWGYVIITRPEGLLLRYLYNIHLVQPYMFCGTTYLHISYRFSWYSWCMWNELAMANCWMLGELSRKQRLSLETEWMGSEVKIQLPPPLWSLYVLWHFNFVISFHPWASIKFNSTCIALGKLPLSSYAVCIVSSNGLLQIVFAYLLRVFLTVGTSIVHRKVGLIKPGACKCPWNNLYAPFFLSVSAAGALLLLHMSRRPQA